MPVKLTCLDCPWEDEVGAREIPLSCPECHGEVRRADSPNDPDDTRSGSV